MVAGLNRRVYWCALIAVVVAGCTNPLSEDAALRLTDREAPVISVLHPTDGSTFGSLVEIRGRVTDGTGNGSPGRVDRVWYSVSPEIVPGADVATEPDGTFDLRFPSTAFTSDIVVRLHAEDWNGNRSETSVTLTYVPSQIPSFRVVPGPRSVAFSWDEPLYSDGYTIHGWRMGESRSTTGSPFVWPDLRNGTAYTFQLQSHTRTGYGADNWSSVLSVTPLAPATLTPRVSAVSDRLTVAWDPLEAVDSYTLLRSTAADGPYTVRSLTSAAVFVDTDVVPGVPYYYRVHPTGQDAVVSERAAGVTNPADGRPPSLLSIDRNGLRSYDVAVYGEYAYVVTNGDGLCVYDVSNPSGPVLLGTGLLGVEGAGMATATVEANRLYVTFAYYDGSSRHDLWVLDLSNPAAPVMMHDEPFALGATARDVVVRDRIVYVANTAAGLRIIDATDPSNLSTVATLTWGEGSVSARSIALYGNYLYLADRGLNVASQGLWAVDIQNPAAPGAPTRVAQDTLPVGALPYWIGVREARLFVIDDLGGLNLYDLTDPGDPALADRVSVEDEVSGTKAPVCLDFVGTTAYVSVFNAGVKVVNVSPGVRPYVMATIGSVNAAYRLLSHGDVVYASDLYSGLVILSPHTQPVLSDDPAVTATSAPVADVAVAGGTLYALTTDGGFQVYEVVADSPDLQGSVTLSHPGHLIEIHGEHAVVLTDAGVTLVNVANAGSPLVVGSAETPTRPSSVTVRGDYAYVAMQSGGLAIYDICVPSEPVEVSTGTVYGSTTSVAIVGSVGYLASGDIGISIVDLSDPRQPSLIGTLSPGIQVHAVIPDGNRLYASGKPMGGVATVICYDVSIPAMPRELSRSRLYDEDDWRYSVSGIQLADRFMYAAYRNPWTGLRDDGLMVLDARAPDGTSVYAAQTLPLKGDWYRLAYTGGRIYVAMDEGIGLFDFRVPEL